MGMQRPIINPMVCVGITAFLVGTAIGIGFGVLIANNRYRNGVGGGIWFGKRRKRSSENEETSRIMNAIETATAKYNSR